MKDNKRYEEFPDITRKIYKKKNKKPIFTNMILSLMLVCGLFFSLFLVMDSFKRVNALYEIINSILFFLCLIGIVVSFPKSFFKKKTGGTVYLSFMVIISIIFNGLYLFGIIKLPTQNHILDYTNKNLTEAITFAENNKIDYEEEFEYSDIISKYNVISQSVKGGTLTKDIKQLNFIISNGPDYEKTVIIPDQSGLKTDDILEFADKNFLKDVEINFEENENTSNDTIINQSITGKAKRNEKITYTASLGIKDNLKPIKLKDLKGEKLLNAETYLGKNGITYELEYKFSSSIKRGCIISTDHKVGTTLNAGDKIVLTVSKGKEIKTLDFKNMTLKEVSKWVIENNLNMEYSDEYNNEIKKGRVISSNIEKDSIIEEETLITFTFSKGKLVLPKFKDLSSFKSWAEKYGIKYEVKEEFNNEIAKDEIIKFSIKEGKKINPDESIIVYISKGESIKTPDFIGKNKNDIQKECDTLEIICSFYNTLSDKKELTAISQSIQVGIEIAKGDNIDIEIATKKQNEVPPKKTNNSSNNQNNSSNQSIQTSTPEVTCQNVTYNPSPGNNGTQTVTMTQKSNPNLNISFTPETSCTNGSTASGSICYTQNTATGKLIYDGDTVSTCDSINVHYIK